MPSNNYMGDHDDMSVVSMQEYHLIKPGLIPCCFAARIYSIVKSDGPSCRVIQDSVNSSLATLATEQIYGATSHGNRSASLC